MKGRFLLVVADLHLDYSKSKEIESLKKLIADYCGVATELVILGDAFESPQRSDSKLRDLGSILKALERFIESGGRIHYVVGNHDLGMTALKGTYYEGKFQIHYPSTRLSINGFSIYLEHGHTYDPLFKNSIYDLMRIIEERVNFKIGDVAENLLKGLFSLYQTKQQEDFGVPEFLNKIWIDAAREILKKEEANMVVFGHTHRPEILKLEEKKYYLNVGSWYKNFIFGTIDGKFAKVLKYDAKKEVLIKSERLGD